MTLACRRFRFWKRQRNEPTAAGVTIQGKRPKLKSLLSPCATAAPQVDLEANRPWQMLTQSNSDCNLVTSSITLLATRDQDN